MRKDIIIPQSNNVIVAIALESDQPKEWKAYIINLNQEEIKNVMITSSGKTPDGAGTSVLRHFIESIYPNTAIPFELVTDELLAIENTFFVTYYIQDLIHDFESEFKPDHFEEDRLVNIPVLNKKGAIVQRSI